MAKTPAKGAKSVETLVHEEARRPNIPTAELQSTADYLEELHPTAPVRYPRARPLPQGERRARDADLDPQIVWNGARIRLSPAQVRQLVDTGEVEVGDAQLVWRGKDAQDWSDLVVQAPPLYIQEKVHPKAIIDDLKRRGAAAGQRRARPVRRLQRARPGGARRVLPARAALVEPHDPGRLASGDGEPRRARGAARQGAVHLFRPALRHQVQLELAGVDPVARREGRQAWPTSRREPEQVKAFRDTWKDGIHSYLTYLRDRLTVARDLLTESGSIFVQIGDENVHRVRAVMDEVFGAENCISLLHFARTGADIDSIFGMCTTYYLVCKDSNAQISDSFIDKKSAKKELLRYRMLDTRRSRH